MSVPLDIPVLGLNDRSVIGAAITEEKLSQSTEKRGSDEQEGAVEFAVPWRIKWTSLVVVMLLPLGVNWASASLGPLKNTLRKEMGINNEQFGVISSADAVINSAWPILGGILLDWVGVTATAPFCTGTILVGSTVAAIGVNINNWRLLAGGYIIQGFGTALLDSCQHVLFHAYGRRHGLAFAFALENAFANATGATARAAAIPIQRRLGTQWVFWIPVVFCFVSCAVNVFFFWYTRRMLPEKYRVTSRREEARAGHAENADDQDKARFNWRTVLSSLWLLPWCFWMLPTTQIFQSGVVGGMQGSFNDIIRMKGYQESVAGFLQAGSQVIKCILGPMMGYAVDRWGHRFHYVAAGPLFWVTCQALFNYSSVHPMVPLVISALAQILSAGPLQMALHLLVADHHLIGTAFGVWRAYSNAGSTVMVRVLPVDCLLDMDHTAHEQDVAFGRLQDSTPGGGYFRVLNLAMGLKALAFGIGIAYIIVDYRYLGRGLTLTRAKRDCLEEVIIAAGRQQEDPLTKRRSVRWVSNTGLAVLGALVVVAWVLFFRGLAA